MKSEDFRIKKNYPACAFKTKKKFLHFSLRLPGIYLKLFKVIFILNAYIRICKLLEQKKS